MKMTDSDVDLLKHYARDNSQDAFAEIVRRHLGLVHTAALRQVRSPQLAEEVAQSVFTDLARQSSRLAPDTILSAWLYEVTRRTAIDVVRREARRQLREQIATEMNAMHATAADWTHIEPLLDEAMHALDATDRTAILLRYFENKSLREVGAALGTSDDTAQKRVSRAVERLREYFAQRGVTVGASGLVVVISAHAVQAAPVGLALTISAAATLAGTVIPITLTATKIAISTMNWTNAKTITAVLASALVAGTGTYLIKQREADHLHTEKQSLLAQQASTVNEREAALSAAKAIKDELEHSKKDQTELLRLRGEIGPLRRQLELQKAQARQKAAGERITEPALTPPGAYIAKGQLAHVGYATPEAALQTITWAMIMGTYDQVNEGLAPEQSASEAKNLKGREDFEARQKVMAPLFKGFQVVAKKSLADDKVELKIRMDGDPIPGQQRQMPPFMIQPMAKVGDVWKLGGSTRSHDAAWESDGQIQTFTP